MKVNLYLKKRVILYVSFFLLAGLATLQSVALAAVNMPTFDSLAPFAATVDAPADVAIDKQGRAYIAETNEDRVTILSQSGNLLARLAIAAPISVAVDADGRILVGGRDNGGVSVFGPDLGFLFKLGAGDGEFGKPMDIAVDAAGVIYVVDKVNHVVDTYNSSGAKTGSIGSPGNGDGQLHHPISIAIDETAGEIVVLDLQQVYDNNTRKMIDGARIQYFDMNGLSLRAYSKFGYNNAGQDWNNGGTTIYDITMGQVTRPKHVAVDSVSRIYVSDARLQKVMVYDNADGFLGTLDNAASPFAIPMGIAMGDSGRLYVASLFTKKVEVFGVDQYTAMVTTPQVVEFNVIENGDAPVAQQVKITNQGNTPITFTTEPQDGWVAAAATTNTLIATEEASINISVDPAGFAPGVHTSSVVVDTGAGALETINITLIVASNPLQVGPDSLDFATTLGTTPASQQLTITSENGSTAPSGNPPSELMWEATVDAGSPWISLDSMAGMTPDTVNVYVDMSTIDAADTYKGTIIFTEKGKADPVKVYVELEVSDSTSSDNLPALGGSGKEKWGKKWTISQQLAGTDLNGVSGTSKSDAFAVGDEGAILHFDGKDWTVENPVNDKALNSVWSSSETDVNAVGAEGLVLNFDGSWTQAASSGSDSLLDIWADGDGNFVTVNEFGEVDGALTYSAGVALRTVFGTAADNVYVAGEAGSISQYDGSTWTPMTSNTTEWINGLWASSSTDIFAVGENGTIVHFDGTEWNAMDSGVTANINGVCGTSATDVYAVGDDSAILYYNGSSWTAMDAGADADLNDIWCSGKKGIIAVGDDGTVIYGKGHKFPWLRVIQQIVDNSKKTRDKNNK